MIRSSHNPTSPDAWKQAVANHTNTLSPAQQLEFKAPATVDDCVYILREHRGRKKAFTRILQVFESLIDTLKRFEGAIDVIVQVNTGIGSPIWGPLRLAITIASDHFKTLERLAFIIDKIATSIKRYHDFETLFSTHNDVKNAIGALYADLICFCTRVVRFHTRSFRYPFVSFDKEFGTIAESIEFHSNEIYRAASLAHMKDQKQARERIHSDQQMENLHQLQRWLSPSTVEDDLQKHLREHMSGSSDWVTTSTEYISWIRGQSNDTLQIVGRPGSGKSTLAAFLVQHLSTICPTVLYFFCDSSDGEKRETIFVLRTLLAQLLKIHPSVQSNILPLFRQSGRAIADSFHVISTAFKAGIGEQRDSDIYVVIDGIDECRDARSLLLHEIKSGTENTRTKVVVTTRARDFRHTGWLASYELIMKAEFSSHHLREYVGTRVQELGAIANTDFAHEVIDWIAESADGLWLYARLMVDEIERAPSKELIERRLNSLPHSLSELYSQILRSCEVRMTEDQREFAKHVYIWLDLSDYMPPFWARNFDRLPYRMVQLIFRYVNEGREVFNAAALARELGAPLIELHHTADSIYELEFVHTTAYKFLAKSSGLPYDELPVILRPQRLNRLHRGMAAAWYFTECSDSERQLESLKDPSKLGEFFGSDAIGCYFEMAYGLLNAFKLTTLPQDLSREEKELIKVMSWRLTDFIRSGQILRYFEMSTIINYSGNHVQLLENVLEALKSTQRKARKVHDEHIAEFEELRKQGKEFFISWAYILNTTTPWRTEGQKHAEHMAQPSGFDENQVIGEMARIGKMWGTVFFEGINLDVLHHPKDEHLISRTSMVVCRRCARVISGHSYEKHACFSCSAFVKEEKWLRRRDRLQGRGSGRS